MGLQRMKSFAYSAGNSEIVEMSRAPQVGPMGVAYLRAIQIKFDVTDVDTGCGGVVTVEEFNDLLSSLDLETGGSYFGPRGLSGADLQALRAYFVGEPLGYIEAEGDQELAACSSNAIRQLLWEFPFYALGTKDSDFSPSTKYLADAGGRLTVGMSALPTNATAVAGTIEVIAHTDERPEVVATPPVIVERQGVDSLVGGSLGRGRMLGSLLKNAGDFVDADPDDLSLFADGNAVVQGIEIDYQVAFHHYEGDSEGAEDSFRYNHGISPIDATDNPRFIPVYPQKPKGLKISKRAVANSWTYDLVGGSETIANLTWVTARALGLPIGRAVDQWTAILGCNRNEAADAASGDRFKFKTASKKTLVRGNMAGHLPVKVTDAKLLEKAGITKFQ